MLMSQNKNERTLTHPVRSVPHQPPPATPARDDLLPGTPPEQRCAHTCGRTWKAEACKGQRRAQERWSPSLLAVECIWSDFLPAPGFCPSYCRRKPVLGMCPLIDWRPGQASPRPERTWWSWVWPASCRAVSSPPSAPRPVGADIGTSPCPASARPFPGEGSPGRRKARRGADARGGRTPTPGPSLRVRGVAGSVPPTPLGSGGPAPCELSLTLQTRSESDQSQTRFSGRAGSSAITGSSQRRAVLSPRRRDPRCKKPQPHRPLRAPHLRGRAASPRSDRPVNSSGRPHHTSSPAASVAFFSSLPSLLPFKSPPLQDTVLAGALMGGQGSSGRDPGGLRRAEGSHARARSPRGAARSLAAYRGQGRSRALGAASRPAVSFSPFALSPSPPLLFIASHSGVFFFPPPPIQEWQRVKSFLSPPTFPPHSSPSPCGCCLCGSPSCLAPSPPSHTPLHAATVEKMGFIPRGTWGLLIPDHSSRGWKGRWRQTGGSGGRGEGQVSTALGDRQHPSLSFPTRLQRLLLQGTRNAPQKTERSEHLGVNAVLCGRSNAQVGF